MRRIEIALDERYNRSNAYECAQVTIEDESGAKRSKLVTVESLMGAFKDSLVRRSANIPVGRIPFGYYDASVGSSKGQFCAEAVTVLPAGKQMIQYEESKYDICMPSLVFCFNVVENRIRDTNVYVIRDVKPSDSSKLYRYPFGNVNKAGTVCWGSIRLPFVRELKDLEEAMMLFIQSRGNSDYFSGKEYCGHEGITLRQLYEMLKDKESYPEEYLVAMKQGKRGMCLEDLLSWKNNIGGRRYV